MGKTSYFNNGEPQFALPDGKLQPLVLSDEDKPLCWDCLWKGLVNCMGFMPKVTGLPGGSKPLPQDEVQEILRRWEGEWQIQPLPPMAVKGPNKQFYIQYTTAHVDGDMMYLSGGFHNAVQVSQSSGRVGGVMGVGGAQMSGTTRTTVQEQNEGQCGKLIFFRAPDGTIYTDNIGSYIISEEPGKIKIMTAAGYPMTILRH